MSRIAKILFGLFVVHSTAFMAQNQVGINTTNPDASAVIELLSTTKGALIPRMTSNQRRNISSPADGLWVYETNTNTYWYAVSGNWVEFISGGAQLDGIGDADADTRIFSEFTADNDNIRFFTLGLERYRMRVGRIDVINTGNSVLIGDEAGLNDDLSDNRNVFIGQAAARSNTIGTRNVALGYQSMLNLVNNNDNVSIGNRSSEGIIDARRLVAIGSEALLSNPSSDNMVAIGYRTMQQQNDRFANTAIGNQSMQSSTNGRSVAALGNRTLFSSTRQSFNVAIGTDAGSEVNNNRGVYIGYLAGSQTTAGNRLYIDNSATNSPLILGEFNNDNVIINDNINVSQDITYVGNLTDVSDRRLKKGKKPLDSQLDKLMEVKLYAYTLIGDSTKEYGCMAQELQAIYPHAVRWIDQEQEYLGVDYFQLLAPLQQGMKEQMGQLQKQEELLNEVEARVRQMEEKLQKIRGAKQLSFMQ